MLCRYSLKKESKAKGRNEKGRKTGVSYYFLTLKLFIFLIVYRRETFFLYFILHFFCKNMCGSKAGIDGECQYRGLGDFGPFSLMKPTILYML